MHKKELLKAISDKVNVPGNLVNDVLNAFTETVVDALKKGKTVRLPKFGTFRLKKLSARKVVLNGKEYDIEEREIPDFTYSTKVKEQFK